MLNNSEEIVLTSIDGWMFREGYDTRWIGKDVNLSDWRAYRPTALSRKNADKNGRVEGVFRMKFRLDSSLGSMKLYIYKRSRDASDVFLDGKLFRSYGETGSGSGNYEEYNPNNKLPVRVSLKPGTDHVVTIHFVDYTTSFGLRMQSSLAGEPLVISLAGPAFYNRSMEQTKSFPIYAALWISITTLLSVLFWFLALQNSLERNLRFIALCSTFFALSALMLTLSQTSGISFVGYRVYFSMFTIFGFLTMGMIPMVISQIFKNEIPRNLRFLFSSALILGLGNLLIMHPAFLVGVILISQSVAIYYIVSFWKSLRGAQWAIVVGIVLTLLSYFFAIVETGILKSNHYLNILITGMYLFLPLSMLVYVSLRFKEIIAEVNTNANRVLQMTEEKRSLLANQNIQLEEKVKMRTSELNQSLEDLKAAQSQLIQSEKMASLGELTAGIAHEIQNPLNFVNNFSEVNAELINELEIDMNKGDIEEAKAIAKDIRENAKKIIHHGKRTEAIVKGMLQHSRTGSGVKKEAVNINALTDEYLRLAYHGWRAKDKNFQVTLKTEYEQAIGDIHMVPRDIGRVILNLVNNAFYAVNERRTNENGSSYDPVVSVSTRKAGDHVEVTVKDNGRGIPDGIKEKIFQPFFTTKPAGSGTGLGLSLSYDIVKAHGGKLSVESKAGEGTAFVVQLPVV
jgi:signal transduction histidine kinase